MKRCKEAWSSMQPWSSLVLFLSYHCEYVINLALTSITILPTDCPSAAMSKNTLGRPIFVANCRRSVPLDSRFVTELLVRRLWKETKHARRANAAEAILTDVTPRYSNQYLIFNFSIKNLIYLNICIYTNLITVFNLYLIL